MPVEIVCESCGSKYSVNERFAGKKAKCRHCGAIMMVPGTPAGKITGSSPMLDSPMLDRPVPRPGSPGDSGMGMVRQTGPRPMPMPQPVARQSSPMDPMILSSNAAEYSGGGGAKASGWRRHLSWKTWVVIGVVGVVVAVVLLILLFDPTVFFPDRLAAPKH